MENYVKTARNKTEKQLTRNGSNKKENMEKTENAFLFIEKEMGKLFLYLPFKEEDKGWEIRTNHNKLINCVISCFGLFS